LQIMLQKRALLQLVLIGVRWAVSAAIVRDS